MLKALNIVMAYLIGCIFTAICVALTYYLPQVSTGTELDSKNMVDMIMVVIVSLVIFPSPLTLIFGLFAYFKKIQSPYFYMLYGVFAIMITLAFIPGLQGVEGDDASLWVPFIGVVTNALAGYLFWYLAIRQPLPKTQQT
ncbi:MAG: hypothetical protein COC24_004055 [Alphaproteobacteria bacterium]|nr:hypothetical protein [Alphaproteobacteria bacterium]